jgi:ABC-type sugar transport system ATPase subunit
MVGINKSFGGVPVLKDVSLEVRAGEVHALLGENGAGKSSLMKILMGVHQPDSGEYIVAEKAVRFSSPAEAQKNRVSMVYQEFGLVKFLSVTENILLGRLPTRRGRVDWRLARQQATRALERLGSTISPDAKVGDLKVADQQEVEIARALSYEPHVFVMDEPSSALSRVEIENLYSLVNILRSHGVAIIYITHKLDEVFALAQRVTILRDGAVVGTYPIESIDASTIVERMAGKPVSTDVRHNLASHAKSDPLLELRNFASEGLFDGIDLTVSKGSVVGITGVIGAGKTELARAIVGALGEGRHVTGTMHFNGKAVDVESLTPYKARALGIGLVSEDRQADGIVQEHTVQFNMVLPALNRVTIGWTLMVRKARTLVDKLMDEVNLRPRDPDKLVNNLSGGNQQKVVISKWLAARSKLLILDEPTRGIDVNARQEIYSVIRRQATEEGTGVLLFSSDVREILLVADRILIMRGGQLKSEVSPDEATERTLVDMMLTTASPSSHSVRASAGVMQ